MVLYKYMFYTMNVKLEKVSKIYIYTWEYLRYTQYIYRVKYQSIIDRRRSRAPDDEGAPGSLNRNILFPKDTFDLLLNYIIFCFIL